MNNLDKKFLSLAHSLAKKQFGKTFPNPCVGCVIVKNGKIISKSATSSAGRPHAEELAIKKANNKTSGSTMYVTLEPCNHHSANGSCSKQIIKAGIRKIFIAAIDPDTRTNGKSIKLFKKLGIATFVDLKSVQSKNLNNFFFKSIKLKRPFIKVKMAISKDYKITKPENSRKWISNKKSREFGHLLRSQSQAILTTYKTIIEDDPRLTIRKKNKIIKYITVIIIDKNLQIPLDSKIIRTTKYRDIIIFTSVKNKKFEVLKKMGCKIFIQKLNVKNQMNLKQIMKKIFELNINNILVEAGGIFFTNLIKNNLFDELHLFTAPFVIGNKGKPMIHNINFKNLKLLKNKKKNFGKDIYEFLYTN